jgi:hypothetical protein
MSVFDNILAKGIRSGKIPGRTKGARDWFRSMAEQAGRKQVRNEQGRTTNKADPGSMYLFSYDPKHKKTLPYYDRFPLIFPLGPARGGFYGINFHYLPLKLRARLMDMLYQVATDKKYDANTKLRLNYQVLKNIARVPYYKPTVKHYLNKHIKSNFIKVFAAEWDIALFLDCARFEKASQQKVWQDSQNMIQGVQVPTVKKAIV